jgi:hypothetical protein
MHTISRRNMESWMPIIAYFQQFVETQALQDDRLVYMLFEKEKAKSFESILYRTDDTEFRHCVYLFYRTHRYKRSRKLWPGIKLAICNLHYYLPASVGYYYYACCVKLFYY